MRIEDSFQGSAVTSGDSNHALVSESGIHLSQLWQSCATKQTNVN
jgi:hypothetical protein